MLSSDDIKHLIIHGAGVEGKAALSWFLHAGIPAITLIDTPEQLSALTEHGQNPRLTLIPEEKFSPPATDQKSTLYLRSPGVPPANPVFAEIRRQYIPHTTPTGYWLATLAPQKTVTVTGTKGKSTTVSLTAHILRWAGCKAQELGNIGLSPYDAAITDDTICVVELSSYMMHDLPLSQKFHAVTSLYREHTDWHGTHDQYRHDKLRPFLNQPASQGLLPRALADEVTDSTSGIQFHEDLVSIDGSSITIPGTRLSLRPAALNDAFSAPSMLFSLRAAIAICLATEYLTPEQVITAVEEHLASWTGLPSRQYIVPSSDSIIWVDDALATVPEATLSALVRWKGRNIHLLTGGDDRGQEFGPLADYCAAHRNIRLYAFSRTGEKLARLAKSNVTEIDCPVFETLEAMVAAAQKEAQPGDVILFSPAAPSAPPHKNFRERSAIFQSFVPKN